MTTWYKNGVEATETEIRNMNPNTVFGYPFDPTQLGWEVVFDTPQPTITELQVVYPNGTTIDTLGNRVRSWLVVDKFSTQSEIDAYLETLKSKKVQDILDNTNLKIPVTIGLYTYNGGDSSAAAIFGAINLAQSLLETTVGIWDINDVTRQYSFNDAMEIAKTIGQDYRTKAFARNDRIAAVNTIVIDPQGTYPDFTSAKTALDLI